MKAALRKIPACQRCHLRKKKCDSNLPACSNCASVNSECLNFDKILGRPIPRHVLITPLERSESGSKNYATEMALDLAADRPSLDELDEEKRNYGSPASDQLGQSSDNGRKRHKTDLLQSNSTNYETYDDVNTFSMSVNTMFSGPDNTANVIDRNLENEMNEYDSSTTRGVREEFIANEVKAVVKLENDVLSAYHKNIVRDQATDISAYEKPLMMRICKRYFTWMNSSYPVMHEILTYDLLERCWGGEASTLDWFQMKMLIAIALGSINRPYISHSEIGQVSKMFWKSAMTLFGRANTGLASLENLQNVLLLLQYTLLVPETGSLWQLSGTAMRFATGMSLYLEPTPSQKFDPLTLDLRRRMFWTCYCIDRTLSTVMGRPATVPDSWITAKLPSIYEDKLITTKSITPGPACNLKVAMVVHVGICRLQSEIHSRLYGPVVSPDEIDVEAQTTWTWQMYDQLRFWRNSLVLPTPLIMKEWTDFQFHLLVVLLLRPLPNRPNPSDEELHVAFHSAGEAMKLVKTMHRDLLAEFSWLTVQNLFMCGLTFINSLREFSNRTPPKSLCVSFVDIVLQVQACTSMLETLSALKVGGDDKMRNVFEVASSNTLHDVVKNFSSLRNAGLCHWELLARSNNLLLQRPVEIDKISVPIQNQSLLEPFGGDDPRYYDYDENHFYLHDTDAQVSGQDASPHLLVPDGEESYFKVSISQRNSSDTEVTNTIFGMDGLAAISTVASEAEPLVSALADYATVLDQTTELERYFLYPI